MKLGILQSDKVRSELVGKFGEYPDMFSRLFNQLNIQLEIISYDVMEEKYPQNIDEVDAYLITGSSLSVYDDQQWIKRLSRFIQQLNEVRKKTIGICFGHQLVAHALGGKTERADSGWHIGTQSHRLNEKAYDIVGSKEDFNLIFSHEDQVISPAKGSQVLASTERCPIAMCKIENHILTIQGHPEFEIEYAHSLMATRRHIFGETLYQEGIDSLKNSNDQKLVAQWIINFIS